MFYVPTKISPTFFLSSILCRTSHLVCQRKVCGQILRYRRVGAIACGSGLTEDGLYAFRCVYIWYVYIYNIYINRNLKVYIYIYMVIKWNRVIRWFGIVDVIPALYAGSLDSCHICPDKHDKYDVHQIRHQEVTCFFPLIQGTIQGCYYTNISHIINVWYTYHYIPTVGCCFMVKW